MNLEASMVSEISQSHKIKDETPKVVRLTDRKQWWLRGGGNVQ